MVKNKKNIKVDKSLVILIVVFIVLFFLKAFLYNLLGNEFSIWLEKVLYFIPVDILFYAFFPIIIFLFQTQVVLNNLHFLNPDNNQFIAFSLDIALTIIYLTILFFLIKSIFRYFKKRYLIIGTVVLVCFIIILGLTRYYLIKKQIQPSPSPITSMASKIDNWKTYTNTKYDYSINYPPTLTPFENPGDIYLHQVEFKDPKATYISGIIVEVRNLTSLEDEINYRKSRVVGHVADKIDSQEPLSISGFLGTELHYTSGEEKFSIAIIPYQKFVYTIVAPSNQLQLYNQLLSTFKFIDKNQSVITNIDTGPIKRRLALIQRLDSELLSQTEYTPLADTNLELKIPPSFSIITKKDSQTATYQNLLAVTDKESDLFWKIWNCNYEYNRVPSVVKSMNESFCKDLLSHYSQKQLDSYQNLKIEHNFFVDKILTSMTPQEWVLDNVGYQGKKLRDQPSEVSRGVTHTINGFSYLAISVMCCGGYEMNYFTQYKDLQGNTILLKFGTNDVDGEIITESVKDSVNTGNIVLDKILATIKKK